jgi:hypothetical protein
MKLSLITIVVALTACNPELYLIDRQTILELEASGDWPELDQKFKQEALRTGAVPLETTDDKAESRKVFSMTHGDQINQ